MQSTHGSSEIALPGNRLARREYDLLSIVPAEDPVFSPVTLRPGEGAYLPGAKLWVSLGAPEILEKDVDFLSTFALNCDMMEKNLQLTIRPRQPGDALRLPGGTRSLKRLMIDRKIPASPAGAPARGSRWPGRGGGLWPWLRPGSPGGAGAAGGGSPVLEGRERYK